MKNRAGLVSNSSSSCFVIFNKTDNVLTLADFMEEFPQVLGNLCHESKKSMNEVLAVCKKEELYPGENYIESSNEDYNGTVISRDLRSAFHGSASNNKSPSFEWKETYNEQWF